MLDVHHPLCFTYDRALRHSQVRMLCMYRGNVLGRIPHKVQTRVHVLTIRTCWTDQNMMQLLTYRHRSRHAQKANRLAEMRSTRAQHHGAQNRDRSSENALKIPTVGQKFSPRGASKAQSADRSSEMQPKSRTVVQKRAMDPSGPRTLREVLASSL